ncbi:uncharacterized protein NPIL_19471 [Nephila pilipes]|uniref:Uncharacterized protein n=1 Tax=Nephila pilipes TaxID=299642 RepID=A0A8X6QGT6_NEPPI|nr:uncharacterized protein NPIL_19471 [Nephila pilipes]
MAILKEEINSSSREGEYKTITDLETPLNKSEIFHENSCEKASYLKYISADNVSAFNTLALWSDPTWNNTNERNPVHFTAVSEWVHHHRIWMATNKVTVAEIIGGVRGVIPQSKLATYGDYRYDLDLEEMYDILEELDADLPNDINENTAYCNESNLNPQKFTRKGLNTIEKDFSTNKSSLSKGTKKENQMETNKSSKDTPR